MTGRRLRVAHLTTVDSTLWYLLRPQLQAVLDDGGVVVGISAPGPCVDRLERDGVRHVALAPSTRGWDLRADLRAAIGLWRILRAERFDVLHTHNPKPGVYGRVVGRLAGVPLVVNTNHGLFFGDDGGLGRVPVLAAEALAARCSDAELVQNPEDFQLLTRWRLNSPRRTWLLGNGVNLERFRPASSAPERKQARAQLGVGPDEVVIGTVGRLVAEKGHLDLIAAARQLGANFTVVVIGPPDPDKADALTDEQLRAGSAAGVRFLGLRDDVELLYRGMDLFVLASHREGFPRAAMEAAASGLATVATDIRGCRQVIDHGVTGLLVPAHAPVALAAALRTLGDDEPRRAAMGTAATARARTLFDERRIVGTVVETYRRADANPRWRFRSRRRRSASG